MRFYKYTAGTMWRFNGFTVFFRLFFGGAEFINLSHTIYAMGKQDCEHAITSLQRHFEPCHKTHKNLNVFENLLCSKNCTVVEYVTIENRPNQMESTNFELHFRYRIQYVGLKQNMLSFHSYEIILILLNRTENRFIDVERWFSQMQIDFFLFSLFLDVFCMRPLPCEQKLCDRKYTVWPNKRKY